jgi:hypothetical protein
MLSLLKLRQPIKEIREEGGIGLTAIARDLVILNLKHQLGFQCYFQYRLFDPRLSLKEKGEYLPDSGWASNRLWSRLTPRQYRLPFDNKLVFNRVFGGQGLPVARVLGVYDPHVGQTAGGRPLRTAADLREWLGSDAPERFVFKPVWGFGGFQVLVFTGHAPDNSARMLTMSGEQYDAERLVQVTRRTKVKQPGAAGRESYLLEEYIPPHPSLIDLVGPTLCCIRMVTVVGLDGTPTILGAVYKIQPEPLGVDHLVYGGLGSWVDLETGRLSAGRSRHHFKYASVIPGTDRSFVGFQLPHWDRVKEIALQAAAVFPWARAIGWDIAISDTGPVLIEGNSEWSTSLLQIPAPRGLLTGEFKRLCDTIARGPPGKAAV